MKWLLFLAALSFSGCSAALRVPMLEGSAEVSPEVAAAFKKTEAALKAQSAVITSLAEYLGDLQDKGVLPKSEAKK